MDTTHLVAHPHRVIARAAAVVGLLGIALIHLLDLPGKIHETPYLGVAYIVLIVAAVAAAAALVHRDTRGGWVLGTVLASATVVAFVVNRTVGMPGATGDIGNWLEPLGLASLFVEAITAGVCFYALADWQTGGPAVALPAEEANHRYGEHART
jgi:hypothetical protein